MNIKKVLAGSAASAIMLANVALPAFAGHNGAVVTPEVNTCEPTTFSATIADPDGTHKVSNMYLTVHENGNSQFAGPIPTNGDEVSLTVGPFDEDTTVSWNVFGGGERSYDQPLWDGFGGATFSSDISAYAAANGGFSWVLDGPDEPNPFTGFFEVEVDKCIVRDAEITSPTPGQNVFGLVDFTAFLTDDDADNIQWAVRQGTCAAGVGTVFGNVDGHSDVATIDQSDVENQTFSFTGDMTGMTPGGYCFIYNPVEDSGESNIRETVEFNLLSVPVNGNQCKKGGWQDHTDSEGNSFKNQGDCVSYVATGGKNLGAGN